MSSDFILMEDIRRLHPDGGHLHPDGGHPPDDFILSSDFKLNVTYAEDTLGVARPSYSLYLLYWYTSTNTDAAGLLQLSRDPECVLSVRRVKNSTCGRTSLVVEEHHTVEEHRTEHH
jgi:hypothetical protein